MNSKRQVVGQACDGLEHFAAFFLRHAGGRLVEQQHLRPGGERQRDLEQALTSVRQFARDLIAAVAQLQLAQDFVGLVDRFAVRRRRSARTARRTPAALGDRKRHRFERD